MWDVMRAQALAVEISRKDSLNDTAETKALMQKVYEIHHINSADFTKSYNWYIKHPDYLRLVFDSLYTEKQKPDFLPNINVKDTLLQKNSFYEMTHKHYWSIDTTLVIY